MGFTVAFLGDTLLGDRYTGLLRKRGYAYAFARIGWLLARADLVVANLEGVLTAEARGLRGTPQRERYWLRADPESAAAMAAAGIRVVSLGNNHVLDYGLDGLAETLGALDEHGIVHCGAGLSEMEARRPAVVTVRGVRVGFYSAVQSYEVYADWLYASGETGGCNRLEQAAVQEDLGGLRQLADVRIALVHWGRTYRAVAPAQVRWAPRLVAAGADLVVGHHPHIAQPVTLVNGRPVLYSLGNGPFGTKGGFDRFRQPGYGLVALAEFTDAGQLAGLQLHLIDVDNARTGCRPTLFTGEAARGFLESLTEPGHGWRLDGDTVRLDLPLA